MSAFSASGLCRPCSCAEGAAAAAWPVTALKARDGPAVAAAASLSGAAAVFAKHAPDLWYQRSDDCLNTLSQCHSQRLIYATKTARHAGLKHVGPELVRIQRRVNLLHAAMLTQASDNRPAD